MKKMRMIDIAVTLIFIAALVVIYFFWGCEWDLVVTLIAAAIVVVAGFIAHSQHKKISELDPDAEEKNK